jgi:ABC-type transport system substrate-binding protein
MSGGKKAGLVVGALLVVGVLSVVLAVVVGVVLSAAISGGLTPTSTPTTVPVEVVDDGSTVADPAPARGGKLSVAIDRDPGALNPSYNRLDGQAWSAATAIYDPLAAYGVDGAIHPFLASGIDHDPQYTQWTIRVRPGVTFHSGSPCDAAAIAANLQDRRTSPLHAAAFAPVTSIDIAPTADAVVVTMAGPYPGFAETLTGPAGLIGVPSAPDPSDKPLTGSKRPVGTGPFVFDSNIPNQVLEMRPNPKYWLRDGAGNPLPYVDAIEFRFIGDPQVRVAALAVGDVDVVAESPPRASVARECQQYAACDSSLRHGAVTAVAFDTATGPFTDPRLRRAAVAATDRERLPRTERPSFDCVPVTVVPPGGTAPTVPGLPGAPTAPTISLSPPPDPPRPCPRAPYLDGATVADGPQVPGSMAGNPPAPVFDPDEGRRLVADATGATPASITLTAVDDDTDRSHAADRGSVDELATALAAQWEAVGFDVTVLLTKPGEAPADADAALVTVGQRVGHQQLHDLFHSTATAGPAPTNRARWSDPATDQALAAAPTAGYKTLWDRVADQAPYLWLTADPVLVVTYSGTVAFNNVNRPIPWRPLPDGTRGDPLTWGGPMLTTAWKDR